MLRWLAIRLTIAAFVFLGITLLTFVMIRAAPGDPVRISLDPNQSGGVTGEAYITRRRAELGLDQPVPIQYVAWLSEVAHGNLGYSYTTRRPVAQVLVERIGPTLRLMGTALAIALLVALPFGVASAFRRNSVFDHATQLFSLAAISIPQFFLGLIAIYVFAITLHVLPAGGMAPTGGSGGVVDAARHLLMPAIIMGLWFAGPLLRYTRASVLETLNEEYLTTARSKGVGERDIARVHALPNALIPIIAVVGLLVPNLVAGAVVIETIFQWPGLGQLFFSSFQQRDYPVMMGFTMLVATFVLLSNVVTDFAYAAVDPRIRLL